MRITLYVVGTILVVIGAVWLLQGINVLPGSFMTGQIGWAAYGALAIVVGITILASLRRRRADGAAAPAHVPQALQPEAEPPPIKEPNPPEGQVAHLQPEVPKIGSRDAPGG